MFFKCKTIDIIDNAIDSFTNSNSNDTERSMQKASMKYSMSFHFAESNIVRPKKASQLT